MKTCTITVQVFVGEACLYRSLGEPPKSIRTWHNIDIMNTSRTRAYATRLFNKFWAVRKKDEPIRVEWECVHDDGNHRFKGALSGVNGIKRRFGIFDA
jgi:ribonuclease HI